MSSQYSSFTRLPPLKGALNFRDMGGYRTTDGASLRWNRLYRSGTTHALTDEDLAVLAGLGIRHAHDFRSNGERARYRNRLSDVADINYWFRDHDKLPGDFKRLFKQFGVGSDHTRALMVGVTRIVGAPAAGR